MDISDIVQGCEKSQTNNVTITLHTDHVQQVSVPTTGEKGFQERVQYPQL